MRRAFVDTLNTLAEQDPRVVFLTGDMGFEMFVAFSQKYPGRYVNVGIAEAQMVCAAAGLALEGFRPVIYSIATFATGRPYELIKISLGYPSLPVVIIGAGGGYCYSVSGPTHHAADDIALMSLIPGMTVVAPGDPGEVTALLPQLIRLDSPSYMRIGKFGEPKYSADEAILLGKARCLAAGEDVAILVTGEMAPIALAALSTLNNEHGKYPALYQFHTVKPIDAERLTTLATSVSQLIVVEESAPAGGLYAAVIAQMAQHSIRTPIVRLGPPDEWILGNPQRNNLRTRYGFDSNAIVKQVVEAYGKI